MVLVVGNQAHSISQHSMKLVHENCTIGSLKSDMTKAVALTVHLKGAAQQVLAALPQRNTIEYATVVNNMEQRFGQKHLAPMKRWELKNRIQKSGEGLQH